MFQDDSLFLFISTDWNIECILFRTQILSLVCFEDIDFLNFRKPG